VEDYEGSILAVSPETLATLGGETPPAKETPPEPEVDMGAVPDHLVQRLKNLLTKYHTLWDGSLGTIRQTEHRIQLKTGATPVRQHPYKAGLHARQMEKEQVEGMLRMEVIEPTNSEWASPVVLVPKPDGTPRFCIDNRRLNERTVKDSYPLPRMDECLDSLGEARVFSTVDCNAGYWQIPVAKEDRSKTAFTCHWGAYQCVRLPFGLSNAPATFQRAMDMILSGVKWQKCLIYLDDVIIFSRTPEDHLAHLDEVLALLAAAGVSLKATKCHLFQTEVEYLGHVITPGRVAVNEKNTHALKGLRLPETQTEVKSFLGMCGVYRRFVPDYAKIAKPLTVLTSTKLSKHLGPPTPEQRGAFEVLKQRLLCPPILALPRLNGDYILDVDASYKQLGCSLLQRQPDGEFHPVGSYSRGLEPREENYFVTEIEALGVVWAVTYLRSYREGTHFIVRCDHSALRGIFMGQTPSHRLNRWRIRLAEYDFEVQHRPGKDHKVADALSRLPTTGLDTTVIPEELPVLAFTRRQSQGKGKSPSPESSSERESSQETDPDSGCPSDGDTHSSDERADDAGGGDDPTSDAPLPEGTSASGLALRAEGPEETRVNPITTAELIAAQATDDFCVGRREALMKGLPSLFYENAGGILCRKAPLDQSVQWVVPKELTKQILSREHGPAYAGHPGAARMYNTLRRRYYWPTIVSEVYGWVAACTGCARNRLHERTHTSLMRLFPATEPFSGLAMDLLGPLPTSENGFRFIMVICDQFTKLTRVFPLRETTALVIASVFLDHWVGSYGFPDTVLTDNEPQFAAVFLQGVMGMICVVTNFTTPYHPQTNGQVERFNTTLVSQLRHYVQEHQRTWDRCITLLVTAYNSQVHTSTKEIPFSFVSPRRIPTLALERFPHHDSDVSLSAEDTKVQFIEHLKELLPRVRKTLAKSQALYKKKFDARVLVKNKGILPGQWILVDAHKKKRNKLRFKTAGPYMVVRTNGYLFTMETPKGLRVVSSDHVTPAPAPEEDSPLWDRAYEVCGPDVALPQIRREGHEFVFDRVVDWMWRDDDALLLKVRWFGCNPQEDTWENSTDLPRETVRKYASKGLSLHGLERRGILFNQEEYQAAEARQRGERTPRRKKGQAERKGAPMPWTPAA